MKHGLMFGGFYPKLGNVMFGVPGYETNGTGNAYKSDYFEEIASMALFRSFGNHKIATYLRKSNWDIECLDYTTEFDWDEIVEYIDSRITEDTVFCGWSVVFTLAGTSASHVNEIIAYIRDNYPHVIHIAGGWYGRALQDIDCDYWIMGNGEFGIEAILKKHTGYADEIEHLHPVTNVNGKKGYVIDAVHSKCHQCFPKPDANISYEERDGIQPYECLSMELSRGCRFACKYCMYPLIGMKEDTTRDPVSLYNEMLENYKRWGVENYYLSDDTVNDRPEKMVMLGEVARKLPFQPFLGGYARLDLIINHGREFGPYGKYEIWDHMIEAGFTAHHYGIETFNHDAGKIIGKGMHPDKVKDGMLEIEEYFTKRAPTAYSGGSTFIAGLEKESMESLQETQDWVNKHWTVQRIGMGVLDINHCGHSDFEKFDLSNMSGKLVSGREVERYSQSNYKFYSKDDIDHMFFTDELKYFFHLNKKFRNRDYLTDGTIWRHPSDDYDMIDAVEFTQQFIGSRDAMGITGETCFRMHMPLLVDWGKKRDTEMKKYFQRYPKKKNPRPVVSHIKKYKEFKLSQEWMPENYV
jgi:hypothetical protein